MDVPNCLSVCFLFVFDDCPPLGATLTLCLHFLVFQERATSLSSVELDEQF